MIFFLLLSFSGPKPQKWGNCAYDTDVLNRLLLRGCKTDWVLLLDDWAIGVHLSITESCKRISIQQSTSTVPNQIHSEYKPKVFLFLGGENSPPSLPFFLYRSLLPQSDSLIYPFTLSISTQEERIHKTRLVELRKHLISSSHT